MIIQIKGTSGSGKTTLVQWLVDELGGFEDVYVPPRKTPLLRINQDLKIVLLGNYRGGDSITDVSKIWALVRHYHKDGYSVVFEGLMISNDRKRIRSLDTDFPGAVRVLNLTTSLEDCLQGITERRKLKGQPTENLDFGNTIRKHKSLETTLKIHKLHGIRVFNADRLTARIYLKEWLT